MTAALLLLHLLAVPARAQTASTTTLRDVLGWVEANSPALAASRLRESEARRAIDIGRASYYPRLGLDIGDSSKLPDDKETLGIGSLAGLPYRSGHMAAAVARADLYDFGRTGYGVDAAKKEADARREDTRVELLNLESEGLRAFYTCALDRSQRETWLGLARESRLIASEVQRYVRIGQRSLVERYLVDDETDQAETAAADYGERLAGDVRLLAGLAGVPEARIACPVLEEAGPPLNAPPPGTLSPLVARASAEAEAARLRAGQARAEYYPRLSAAAAGGRLAQSGLPAQTIISIGVGLDIPVFQGFGAQARWLQAKDAASEREQELAAAEQRLALAEADLDRRYASAGVRARHLEEEAAATAKALALAKERYTGFQGTLVDVREALRNSARVRTGLNEARAQQLEAAGTKSLLEGAR